MSAPEIIEGLGQFRAGWGDVITGWCATRAEAVAEFWRLYWAAVIAERDK